MKHKVLLVEDESDLALIVSNTLQDQGYSVIVAEDGIAGLEMFKTEKPAIIVSDVMMPRMDGFCMAREIRRIDADVPILFLTAKNGIDDIEHGFKLGANDYIRKPFELRELIVRIQALLRGRTAALINIGSYTFDASTQTLSHNKHSTVLSYFEARILALLASNMGNTVDGSTIMIELWGRNDASTTNSLHGYIHKLRRTLRHDASVSIINQRGYGYMLAVKNQPQ